MKLETLNPARRLHGVIAYLLTPFDAGGAIDRRLLVDMVDQVIEDGVHGLAPLGSAGVQSYLSEAERYMVLETVCERAAGRLPVVAGASSNTTAGAVQNAQFAERCGAAALLVAPTSDWKLTASETYRFYERVADSVGIPIMVYDTSMKAGGPMPVDQLVELANIPGVTMVKDSSGDIERLQDLLLRVEGRLDVFAGKNTFAVPALMLGCRGWCSATPMVAAAATIALYRAAAEMRDLSLATEMGAKLQPLLQALVRPGLPRSVLAGLELIGRPAGHLRPPLMPVTQSERAEIARALALLNEIPWPTKD